MTARRPFLVALAVALLAAAYGAGRYAAPSREETRVVTVERVRLQEVVRVEEKLVEVKEERRKGRQEWARTTAPDGTVTEAGRVVWDDSARTEERRELAFSLDSQLEQDRRQEETRVVERDAPRWLLGVGAGAAVGIAPLSAGPVYSGLVAYRFAGPFSAWAAVGYEPGRSELTGVGGLAIGF